MEKKPKETNEMEKISSQSGPLIPFMENFMYNPLAFGLIPNLMAQNIYGRQRSFSTDAYISRDLHKKDGDIPSENFTVMKETETFSKPEEKETKGGQMKRNEHLGETIFIYVDEKDSEKREFYYSKVILIRTT